MRPGPPHHGDEIPFPGKDFVHVKDEIGLSGPNRPHGILNLGDTVDLRMSMINPPSRKHLPRDAHVTGVPHLEVPRNSHVPI